MLLCGVAWRSVISFQVKSSFKLTLIQNVCQTLTRAFSVSFPRQSWGLIPRPSPSPGRPSLLTPSTGSSCWSSWRTASSFRRCCTAEQTRRPPECRRRRPSPSPGFLSKSYWKEEKVSWSVFELRLYSCMFMSWAVPVVFVEMTERRGREKYTPHKNILTQPTTHFFSESDPVSSLLRNPHCFSHRGKSAVVSKSGQRTLSFLTSCLREAGISSRTSAKTTDHSGWKAEADRRFQIQAGQLKDLQRRSVTSLTKRLFLLWGI